MWIADLTVCSPYVDHIDLEHNELSPIMKMTFANTSKLSMHERSLKIEHPLQISELMVSLFQFDAQE